MGSGRLTALALVALLALVLLVWVAGNFLTRESGPIAPAEGPPIETAPPAPVVQPPAPPPVVQPEPTPAPPPEEPVAGPVEPVLPEPAPEPLPPLGESDDYVREQVAGMDNGAPLLRHLADQELVRRFVVFVDNVRMGSVPEQELPFVRDLGELRLREVGEDLYVMEVESHARFTPLLDTLLAMDDRQILALYRNVYPLLQEAYTEIGYPRLDFTDTLLAAIDTVLRAELPEGPFLLTRPSVMYLYADEDVESLTGVEKLLLRLGPENSERLRDRLRALRRAVEANRP